MDLIYFFGRFHVLALHLPIGAILIAVLVDWLARDDRRRALEPAARVLWGLAAVTAVATAVLGYMHFAEGRFDGPSAAAHRAYGTAVAVAAAAVWWLRARGPHAYRRVHFGAAAVLVVLLVLAGHHGGNLTHGSTYLVEYAPGPVQSLTGHQPASRTDADTVAAGAIAGAGVDQLEAAEYLVRRVSQSDPRLIVSVNSPGTAVGAEQLAALEAAASGIVELNLQRSQVDDEDLAALPVLPVLTHLRLDNNAITDAGLALLARQPQLRVVNLHGNAAITDAGVAALARVGSLRKAYLWHTGVSSEGIAELRRLRPDLDVEPTGR